MSPRNSYLRRDRLTNGGKPPERQCLHKACADCKGTGRDQHGRPCIHAISCPCPRCSPSCMAA